MQLLRKFRWPIVIFLVGLAVKLFGAWGKITHMAFADTALTIGFFTQMLAVFITLFIIIGMLFTRTPGEPPKA
ncbi:hypothetical protein [Paraflavitalea sp. CAU 1676]|uniref:hypothetical protein n=1 Tax=Paraflavitalea sp. CAU 1676 TaxID=3032598 RepID=UPI0023DBE8A8|nr:hypothetical protein [Paraflavitalea sp. CAU 1676]MDF2189217.1 hypothetical protein [Paraflavitalea sp. CAU 1676]